MIQPADHPLALPACVWCCRHFATLVLTRCEATDQTLVATAPPPPPPPHRVAIIEDEKELPLH